MGIALSSIGVQVSYAVETTPGTRPDKNYVKLPDIKSIPSINPAPNTADATTFDNLEYTSYISTLKDLGGALELSANFTEELFTAWETMLGKHGAGLNDDKRTWFCFDIPGFEKSAYLPVIPSPMGIPEISTNSLIETTLYITPMGEPEFAEDPTYAVNSSLLSE